ncbi:ParA family protein, partial [Staphylococcus pseudintermedius]|nr:ParA family protein [Staphylococcus pseudintermedius]HEC2174170.1 ParA family protein [Staphylococcus delphini]
MTLPSKFWKNNKEESELLNNIRSRDEAIVFTINMFKGGVGKSTLSNLFGYIANRYDLKVLFIDTDPQRTLTKKLSKNFSTKNEANYSFMEGIKKGTLSESISTLSNNIDVIKGDWNLAWFDRFSRRSLNIKDEFYVYSALIQN